jgi:hypothetical protein
MYRLSNHGLLAPLAPIVAPLLINGWFGYENLGPTSRSILTASRNRDVIASVGRAAKHYQVTLITALIGPRRLAVQPQTWS